MAGARTAGRIPASAPRRERAPEYGAGPLAFVGLVLTASLGLFVATGSAVLALVPLGLIALFYTVWSLPVRYTFYPFAAAVILADIMPRDPANPAATWRSIAFPLQRLLLDNLNVLTGVDALRFSGTEVVLVFLLLLCTVRTLAGVSRDTAGTPPMAKPLMAALAVSLAGVLFLEVWGLARGGDFRQSLWQFRQLLWFPFVTIVAACALRGAEDFMTLGRIVTWTASVKVFIGLYYFGGIAKYNGPRPDTVTSHHDTVLFVTVIAIGIATYMHRRTPRQLFFSALSCAWMLFGIYLNARRTAYVSLIAVFAVLFIMQPVRPRRKGYRLLLRAAPLFAAYIYAGNFKTTGIFSPAADIVSVFNQQDSSNSTRDIENYNLIQTLKQGKLMGSGWGHMYQEQSVAYSISDIFQQYRYIAHNSVLWLWSIGGLLGFTAIWTVFGMVVFFAVRSYDHAVTAQQRTAACVAASVVTAFVVQAWADMGTQSWTGAFLLASAAAISGKMAAANGGWPLRLRAPQHTPRPAPRIMAKVA
jgi:hypothetical protein